MCRLWAGGTSCLFSTWSFGASTSYCTWRSKFDHHLFLLCAHSCLRCLSSSRSSLRSGPRKCMARTDSKKTLGKRCDVTGQVIVDKLATTFVSMWCGALWSHKDSLQWLIALKCKPHSTLQLQIFAESFKLSLWLLQVWVQFSPHIQYENINGPVVI